jgi:hypothetical protein
MTVRHGYIVIHLSYLERDSCDSSLETPFPWTGVSPNDIRTTASVHRDPKKVKLNSGGPMGELKGSKAGHKEIALPPEKRPTNVVVPGLHVQNPLLRVC